MHTEPAAFNDLPHREQIDGALWILGWIRWALLRMTKAGIRHRLWYQRVAQAELVELMKCALIKTDPYVYRVLYMAKESTESAYADSRPIFPNTAGDEIQRAMAILRERRAES